MTPTVVIETLDRNILIKEYDSMTIVLKSIKNDDWCLLTIYCSML